MALGKNPDKKYSVKKSLLMYSSPRPHSWESHLARLSESFLGFGCQVPEALGKTYVSDSDTLLFIDIDCKKYIAAKNSHHYI